MPNITTNHAFTHTNSLIISGLAHTQKAPVELFNQGTQTTIFFSLRSKRFQSSYCAKNREETKKRLDGEGEGRRGNACPQTPRFWKTPLDISRFGSFVN